MSNLDTLARALGSDRYPVTGEPARDYLAHFQLRVLQDAWLEQDPAYWLRRADAFAAVGTRTCDEIALACRNRATLCDTSLSQFLDALASLEHDDTEKAA